MAEKWYPVVDIVSCIVCGTCIEFCTHGVFDKARAPVPAVILPAGCVDLCHGCGDGVPWEQSPMQETQQGGFRRYLG